MNTDSIDMVRRPDDEDAYDMPLGGFNFHTSQDGFRVMWVKLPSGTVGVLRLRPYTGPDPAWEWNGNEDKPTLSPSVHSIGRWHGWIRDGRLVSC